MRVRVRDRRALQLRHSVFSRHSFCSVLPLYLVQTREGGGEGRLVQLLRVRVTTRLDSKLGLD